MVSLLARLFIKDYKNVGDSRVRRAYGMLSCLVGIGLNVFLFILKYIAGTLSGAISILADAFNNLSDAGSSFITLVGFKFAGSKPDRDHPFGHGRIEYISGFAVSLVIILMGFELGKSSLEKILAPETIESSWLTVAILVVSICVKLYMYSYNRRIGRQLDAAGMRATAADSLSDSVATAVVLASVLISRFTGVNVDGWCGCAVALFILYSGYSAARDTLSPLLGQQPSPAFIKSIEEIVMAHSEILGMHDLIVHDYGPGRKMISLHGEVDAAGDLLTLHDVIDNIERELTEKLRCDAVIHMDPIDHSSPEVENMRREVTRIAAALDQRVSIHDFRMVTGPTHTNLIFDAVVPQPFPMTDEQVRQNISEQVQREYDGCYCVIHVDKSYV